ncbi:MAG: sigma-70 family RNA polymerase sigma factor [Ekhidna sp.]
MTQTQAISLYQPKLQSIAYKLLGSMADAEDAVQDAFVKWLSIDTSKIENIQAYLIRMVTNSCLNLIQSKKNKPTSQVDELAEELVDSDREKEITHFDLESQLNEALKYIHRRLEPVERTVYVLREVFNVEYEDLQNIVDRKADNCRKIVSRAKLKLKKVELPKLPVSLPEINLVDSFKSACQKGNLTDLVNDFHFDFFHKRK